MISGASVKVADIYMYRKHCVGGIKSVTNNKISFEYKDYRDGAKKHLMELDGIEFIRRFSKHILPKGFTRIRHYGILSSTRKKITIPQIIDQLEQIPIVKIESREIKVYNPKLCPCCKTETMITIELLLRGPPALSKYHKEK